MNATELIQEIQNVTFNPFTEVVIEHWDNVDYRWFYQPVTSVSFDAKQGKIVLSSQKIEK